MSDSDQNVGRGPERTTSMTREQRLARVFVELADTLVDEFDAVDFLSTLVERSVELLAADAAGVILRGARGTFHVVAVRVPMSGTRIWSPFVAPSTP